MNLPPSFLLLLTIFYRFGVVLHDVASYRISFVLIGFSSSGRAVIRSWRKPSNNPSLKPSAVFPLLPSPALSPSHPSLLLSSFPRPSGVWVGDSPSPHVFTCEVRGTWGSIRWRYKGSKYPPFIIGIDQSQLYTLNHICFTSHSSLLPSSVYRMKLSLIAIVWIAQSLAALEQNPKCLCPENLRPCTTCFLNPPPKGSICSETCYTQCVDFTKDPNNCGFCGNAVSFFLLLFFLWRGG